MPFLFGNAVQFTDFSAVIVQHFLCFPSASPDGPFSGAGKKSRNENFLLQSFEVWSNIKEGAAGWKKWIHPLDRHQNVSSVHYQKAKV